MFNLPEITGVPAGAQVFEVNHQAQTLRDVTPSASNPLLEAFLNEGRTWEDAHRLYRMLKRHDPVGELTRKIKHTALGEALKNSSGHVDLLEAFVASPDAATLLRDGVRFLSMLAYAELPSTFAPFTTMQGSDRQQEEWLRDSIMGTLPRVKSGDETPMLRSGLEGGALIKNYSYAGLVEVTGDDIRFDRLGKIRQAAPELGRSGRMTEEVAVYTDITTTANFSRNSTTKDNDVGANTQTLTFSALGFETAYTIVSTAKDRKSGAYLGLTPNAMICGPLLMFAAKQLLFSPDIWRASANNAAEVRGTGTVSPYVGMIERLIVSPWFGQAANYGWALVDTRRQGYFFQTVEPFNVYSETAGPTSEAWLRRDSLRYKVFGYFGSGFVDDRPWFYSDSTTAPTIS